MVQVTRRKRQSIVDRLPSVRGELRLDESMARYAWLRVGGPAEVLFRPADTEDLQEFLHNTPIDIPIFAMGVASNLLVRDGGIPGVVIQLRKGFNEIVSNQETITAGTGALDINVARFALAEELEGLEFLSGIPGTIGGALRMNAGAYGSEIADVLVSAEAIDRNGNLRQANKEELGFAYRHTDAPQDWIFIGATLAASPGDSAAIAAKMEKIAEAREGSQPIRARTGGSTFKNTDEKSAWELIDDAGCRGLRVGEAQVSEHHCNFLINHGQASAYDLERLGAEVRRRVHEKSGVMLQWELDRIGLTAKEAQS
ncbi:MAG TPA: UDP-N-acetylenolpyruvoylglucosamine reductase [Rhodospirillaceae bacterium]|nr:UDP-N-acetylenolpyruvoylglucosamine reductase [Rhodospirillaceae bacterium]HAA90805.1 UDP-N-acetylenolpyruvoylglucosamine reductase [Rhodospirillaceae bacterium]HAT35897.1 UDP-N-acetylenolpyruvoylglucosamine reductase [Rhodospirillaceae bacterium]